MYGVRVGTRVKSGPVPYRHIYILHMILTVSNNLILSCLSSCLLNVLYLYNSSKIVGTRRCNKWLFLCLSYHLWIKDEFGRSTKSLRWSRANQNYTILIIYFIIGVVLLLVFFFSEWIALTRYRIVSVSFNDYDHVLPIIPAQFSLD